MADPQPGRLEHLVAEVAQSIVGFVQRALRPLRIRADAQDERLELLEARLAALEEWRARDER